MKFVPKFVALILMGGAVAGQAQSLGDIARHERARIDVRRWYSQHVFTNEDLQQQKIVPPEVRGAVAHGGNQMAPELGVASINENSTAVAPELLNLSGAVKWPEGTALGDIAQYYRVKTELQTGDIPAPLVEASVVPEQQPTEKQPTPVPAKRILAATTVAVPAKRRKVVVEPVEAVSFQLKPTARILASTGSSVVPPAAQNRAATQQNNRIRVKANDTLWRIAKQYLGSGYEWTKIVAANPGLIDAKRVRAGQWLRLPEPETVIASQKKMEAVSSSPKIARIAKQQITTTIL
jgi:LysM repeat protein